MREKKRKVTHRMGENWIDIYFVLIKKNWRFLQNAKAIFGKFQLVLVVADIDNKECSEKDMYCEKKYKFAV